MERLRIKVKGVQNPAWINLLKTLQPSDGWTATAERSDWIVEAELSKLEGLIKRFASNYVLSRILNRLIHFAVLKCGMVVESDIKLDYVISRDYGMLISQDTEYLDAV